MVVGTFLVLLAIEEKKFIFPNRADALGDYLTIDGQKVLAIFFSSHRCIYTKMAVTQLRLPFFAKELKIMHIS